MLDPNPPGGLVHGVMRIDSVTGDRMILAGDLPNARGRGTYDPSRDRIIVGAIVGDPTLVARPATPK